MTTNGAGTPATIVPFERRVTVPTVLVVDDDEWTRQTIRLCLRNCGIDVYEADSDMEGIVQAQQQRIDLAVLDLRLPDISALQMVEVLKKQAINIPWILYSGYMTVSIAVEAIKRGAMNAVELPFNIDSVVLSALADTAKDRTKRWPLLPVTKRVDAPKSTAERWAWFILRGCDAKHDVRTLAVWAHVAGTSYSGLAETCRMMTTEPHQTRDFMRLLRVLFHNGGRVAELEAELDVRDERTLRRMLERGGLAAWHPRDQNIGPFEFIERQRFVDPHGVAATTLARIIQMAAGGLSVFMTAT